MRLSRKLGRVQYNGHRDIDRWQHDEMDQPGFLEETASEYGCTSKEELEKKKRHGKGLTEWQHRPYYNINQHT